MVKSFTNMCGYQYIADPTNIEARIQEFVSNFLRHWRIYRGQHTLPIIASFSASNPKM